MVLRHQKGLRIVAGRIGKKRQCDTLDIVSLNVKNVKTNLNFVKYLSSRFLISFPQETWLYRYKTSILAAVADPEGVQGVRSNPPLIPNYFIIMGNFEKSRVN